MYPAPFEYSAPRSLDEALAQLAEVGEEGRVLAGGQSLIPMMKLRLAEPAHLVDINRIPDLDQIGVDNGHLSVGALVRHAQMAASDVVSEHSSLMASAAPWIADPLVRNRGTLCGSVAHCDPEGDWNSVLLALGATVVARSHRRRAPHPDLRVRRSTSSPTRSSRGRWWWSGVPRTAPGRAGSLPQAGAEDRRLRHRRRGHPHRARRRGKNRLVRAGPHPSVPINIAVSEARRMMTGGRSPPTELFSEPLGNGSPR